MSPRSTPWRTYTRIAETLRRRIADGDLPPGSALPSEAALGQEFRVSRTTVRRALATLEGDGLVTTLPGTGRVVRDPGEDDASSSVPRYRRIAAELREQITDGTFAPGAALPSESALVRLYGVSRGTARQALSELEGSGLIVSVHGKGRFVRESDRPPR
ncbi:Transcriptional regulators [Marinactinospora thermotolerans DSM 45154]|uniref:Transcriptional regulators n=1 Tax=Marinactinospora thermotolerans DSM 45154 TaxID=1122192 RepID=A0A1T4RE36_9ACTN|nr:GntR family transcriptional regulator [Marinactinospora thermotolerans]SKA14284.1 Transcriptional regulators [Marinactinospora thermotolerans DSM 45154]